MKTDSIKRARRPRAESGQDLVEFALILPILFLVLVGLLDMGRITYYVSALHNAAREGARHGSLFPEDTDGVRTAVENFAVGIPSDELDVIVATSPVTIQVTVAYTMPFVTPFIGAIFSAENEIPLGSRATNPLEN